MMEDGEWGGESENVAFSEVYSVNIIVYDAMSCSTTYLIAENENATHIVYLLMIKNNHFNTLKVKGQTKSTDFQKVKNKDYKKKLESKIEKSEKDHSFMGEFLSVYSQNTLNDIKQYLENNIYPQKITPPTRASI